MISFRILLRLKLSKKQKIRMETTPKTIPIRMTLTPATRNLTPPDAARNGILPWTTLPPPLPRAYHREKRGNVKSCGDRVIIILNPAKLSAIPTVIHPRLAVIVLPNRGLYRQSGGRLLSRRKGGRLRPQLNTRKAGLVRLQRTRILTRVWFVGKL